MGKTVTVSAKIDESVKKKMDELGISPSEVIKRALETQIQQKEWENIERGLDEIRPLLKKVGKKEWVRSIREDRDSH
jgi:antitoxin component of RelBE/YafQ-DinJ toxin-antitoxin module